MSYQLLGHHGERYVAGKLALMGATVQGGGPADLLVNGVPIEVKTANYCPYRPGHLGYQFCLRRENHTSVKGIFVILLCWERLAMELEAFVIPASEIDGQYKITIPNRPGEYGGRWAKWLNEWGMIV